MAQDKPKSRWGGLLTGIRKPKGSGKSDPKSSTPVKADATESHPHLANKLKQVDEVNTLKQVDELKPPRAAINGAVQSQKASRNGFFGKSGPVAQKAQQQQVQQLQQQPYVPSGPKAKGREPPPPRPVTPIPHAPRPASHVPQRISASEKWQEVYQSTLDENRQRQAWAGHQEALRTPQMGSKDPLLSPFGSQFKEENSLRVGALLVDSHGENDSGSISLLSTRSTSSLASDESEEAVSPNDEDASSTGKSPMQALGRPPAWAVDPKLGFGQPQGKTAPPESDPSQEASSRPPPWAVEPKGFRAAALGSSFGSSTVPALLPLHDLNPSQLMFSGEMVALSRVEAHHQQQQQQQQQQHQQEMPFWGPPEEPEPKELRVVSLVGAATDIIVSLGLEETLVARSHECIQPGGKELPCVTSASWEQGHSGRPKALSINAEAILSLQPTLIIVQEACDLCSVSLKDLQNAMREHLLGKDGYSAPGLDPGADLYGGAQLITIRPFMMSDIWDGVKIIAEAGGRPERGHQLVEELKQRWAAVRQMVPRRRRAQRVRVACLGQLRPLAGSGYWIPEVVACAGGIHIAGKAGERTEALSMELLQLLQRDPDIVVIACRGSTIRQALETLMGLQDLEEWDTLAAVRTGRVYMVDGSRYFNSPGPRVVDSVEIMADILQKDFMETSGADAETDAWSAEGGRAGGRGGVDDRGASGEEDMGSSGGGGSSERRSLSWRGRSGGNKSKRVWPLGDDTGPKEKLQQAIAMGSAFARLPGNSAAEWRQDISEVLQSTGGLSTGTPLHSTPGGVPSAPPQFYLQTATEGSQQGAAPPPSARPEQLRQLLMHTISQALPADGLLLSGGLGSSVLAHCVSAIDPEAVRLAITVLAGSKASDKEPAARAAAKYGMRHVVVGGSVRPESLLSSELRFVVRTLKTFDPAEVRAGIAMAACLREAKRRGCTCLMTGDGADELFSAFEFLAGMSEDKAFQCRKHVQETMRFPVVDLARAMGIQIRQPFLHPAVREFALGLSKGELQCDGHELLHSWGTKFAESKLLLRLAFPEVEASQRRSDAIEVGAGTYVLTKRLLKRTSKEEFEKHKERVQWEDVVDLRDAEQLHYYQAFRDEFEGLLVPGVQRWGLNACLSCGYPPLFEGQLACTTCGEYPARRLTKLVMEGWEGKAGGEERYSPALQQKMLSQVQHTPKSTLPPGLPKSPFSPSWKRDLAAKQHLDGMPPGENDLLEPFSGHGASSEPRREKLMWRGAGLGSGGEHADGGMSRRGKTGEVDLEELFALHEVFLVFGGSDGMDCSLPSVLDHVRDGLRQWRSVWPAELSVC